MAVQAPQRPENGAQAWVFNFSGVSNAAWRVGKGIASACVFPFKVLGALSTYVEPHYWVKRLITTAPPGPSLLYLIRNGAKFEDFAQLLDQLRLLQEKHGDIFSIGYYKPVYFLTDPDDIHKVMTHPDVFPKYPHMDNDLAKQQRFLGKGIIFTPSDAEWQEQRTLLAPSFRPMVIYDRAIPVALRCLNELNAKIHAAKGEAVNISEAGFLFSGTIIFDLISPHYKLTLAELQEIKKLFEVGLKAYHQRDYDEKIKSPRASFDQLARKLIETDLDHPDKSKTSFVQILYNGLKASKGEDVPREEVIRILSPKIINLFVAGFETTATTFGWILYLLARHPEVQDRARKEIATALPQTFSRDPLAPPLADAPPADKLSNMEYLNAVIKESQRLNPELISYNRYSSLTCNEVLGNKHTILPDCEIRMLPFLANRHPKIWDRPNDFIPDRFLMPLEEQPAVVYSFGNGPRRCIGDYLAKRELQLLLITTLSRFKMTESNEVKQIAGIVMHPDKDIMIKFAPVQQGEL